MGGITVNYHQFSSSGILVWSLLLDCRDVLLQGGVLGLALEKSMFPVEAYRKKQQGVAGSETFLGAEEEAEHPTGQRGGGEARLGQSWGTKGFCIKAFMTLGHVSLG